MKTKKITPDVKAWLMKNGLTMEDLLQFGTLDELLDDPLAYAVPDKLSVLELLVHGLARKTTEENIARIITYVERLNIEWQVVYLQSVQKQNPELIALNPVIRMADRACKKAGLL